MRRALALALGWCMVTGAGVENADSPSRPWGFPGHRIVCEIAWHEMSDRARDEARRLTEAFGRYQTFADSCVWADSDEARRLRDRHWINVDRGAASVSTDDCPSDCPLRHLDAEMGVLAGTRGIVPERARALMFVGHLVGDLHAPMHVAYEFDRGGNDHPIDGLGGRVDDLHGVWDSYLIRDQAGRWRAFALELHADVNPVDRTLWAAADPLVWAQESYRIVEDYVYENLEGPGASRLSRDYVGSNRRRVERQLKKAGVRLGDLLNRVLGPRS